MSELAEMMDVFFNGRPAHKPPVRTRLTVIDLIERNISRVKYNGKIYRITVKEEKNDPA